MIKKYSKPIIAFLTFIVILLTTNNFGSEVDLVSHVGFAGTLISIILAVMAIIYTYYQNSFFASSASKLEDVTDEVKDLTGKIDTSVNNLSSEVKNMSEFQSIVDSLNETVYSLKKTTSNIETKIDDTKKSVENLGSEFRTTDKESEDSFISDKFTYEKDDLLQILLDKNRAFIIVLYILYKASVTDKETDMFQVSKFITNLRGEEDRYQIGNFAFIYGIINSFTLLGGMSIKKNETKPTLTKVTFYNENLGDAICEAVKQRCDSSEEKAIFNEIDNYFE